MAMSEDMKREREWLVWLVRLLMAGGLSWIAYTVYNTSITVEGIRVLAADQNHRLERLELWQDANRSKR